MGLVIREMLHLLSERMRGIKGSKGPTCFIFGVASHTGELSPKRHIVVVASISIWYLCNVKRSSGNPARQGGKKRIREEYSALPQQCILV
jgi:hypothetical protein